MTNAKDASVQTPSLGPPPETQSANPILKTPAEMQEAASIDPPNKEKVNESNQDMNNMVAKVTIETPSGASTKYYLLYRDRCFSLSSLLVGMIGGVGVGFYSRIFFEQWRKKPNNSFKTWKKQLPFSIPEVKLSFKVNNRLLSVPLLFGNTVWWRIGTRAVASSVLYSALECQFQGTWFRRTYFDCGAAGAISGAVFGFRGVPGLLQGSAIGALGFGTFAVLCRFLFL